MEKVRITKRIFTLTAVIGSLVILAMVVANTLWSSRQAVSATDEAVSAVSAFYLDAMAERRAHTITNQIDNNFEHMEKARVFIEEEEIASQEQLRETLGKIKSLLSLNRFALVDEDNVVYTQYTTYTGGSRHEFLSREKMEDRIVSAVTQYGSSRQLCLAIPTPGLIIMGKPFKACFVQIDMADIVNLLALDDQGKTYFGLYSKNGGNLSGTELGPVISDRNIFDATEGLVPEAVWQETRDHFAKGEAGRLSFSSDGAAETLCYVPIQNTGWEIAVLIRESVIQDQIREISERSLSTSRNQIVFTLVATLVLAAVLLAELAALSNDEIEAEKKTSMTFREIANTDSLTGVRNKHAYSELEALLNRKIEEKEIQRLAVAVCDINGLKHVNDTQGHAAGDKLIKDACAMICNYFKHGAVFRIGGDEFAVILQNEACDALTEVLNALNRKVEENVKTNGVVVSVGSSVLKQEDRQLRDVFDRADQIMYERKKELKAMGAKTRLY